MCVCACGMVVQQTTMKTSLFIGTLFASVKCTSATCNGTTCAQYCDYTECAKDCQGNNCGQFCTGDSCAQNCQGSYCGTGCIGMGCAKNCQNSYCGANCIGKDCAAECNGTACDFHCFHFENENCTDNPATTTYTMGTECGTDNPDPEYCIMKNHPSVWQALKETETQENLINLPTKAFKPCYHNNTHCVNTVDALPPLLCNHFVFCIDGSNAVNEVAKCTEAQKCGLCQGICEKDSECKGNLKCFLRTGTETVPGCSSSSSGPNEDVPGKGYCADMPDSSTLNDGEIAAIAIGAFAFLAACALAWCYRTKRGFFGTSGGMAETIKL